MKSICSDKIGYKQLPARALYMPASESFPTVRLTQNTPGPFCLHLTHLSIPKLKCQFDHQPFFDQPKSSLLLGNASDTLPCSIETFHSCFMIDILYIINMLSLYIISIHRFYISVTFHYYLLPPHLTHCQQDVFTFEDRQ